MAKWEYDISRHTLQEVQEVMVAHGYIPGEESRVLFCDTQGVCYFDEAPDPYVAAIKDILNARGEDAWELVQVLFREKEFICFWRRTKG